MDRIAAGQASLRRNSAQIADENPGLPAHSSRHSAVGTDVSRRKRYRLLGPDGVEVLSTTPGALGGHLRTRVYGRLDCPVALGLIRRGFDVRTRVFFADEATAIAAGYRPCGACLPEEYRRWKAQRLTPPAARSLGAGPPSATD